MEEKLVKVANIPPALFKCGGSYRAISYGHCVYQKLKNAKQHQFHVSILVNIEDKTYSYKAVCLVFGGDEGNRTPVRKSLATVFSECSLCFKIPLAARPQTGLPLR